MDQGQLDEAFASLAELAAQKPELPETGLMLGRAYVKNRRWPEAIDCYRDAIRLKPDHPEAWYELGTTCERQGDRVSALAAFQEVLCLAPDHAAAHAGILRLEPAGPASDAEWHVGDALDLYDVTGLLGEGGMGRVHKLHHRGWGVDLAVKTPRPEIFARPGGKDDFVREAETWVALGVHPHVVSCHYVRTLGGLPRVFAECVDGGTLGGWIRSGRLYEGGAQRALLRILDVAIQFAWGLHYAHEQGLVHQDVKPANVLMTADGIVKVADFGLARARGAAGEAPTPAPPGQSVSVPGCGFMTPQYCSPEQESGRPLSRRTDIWSWGLSVIAMFVGGETWLSGILAPAVLEAALEHGSQDPRIPPLPQAVAEVLRRCFLRDPDQRPRGLVEVAETLRGIHEDLAGHPYPRSQPSAAELTAPARNNQALSFFDLGKRRQAEAAWESALAADPLHAASTYNRGVLLWRRGDLTDEAFVTSLELVRANHPNEIEPAYLLGLAWLERLDLHPAMRLFPGATEDHERKEFWALIGDILRPQSGASPLKEQHLQLSDVHVRGLSADGHWALDQTSGVEAGPDEARVWDVRSGRCVCRLKHPDRVTQLALSPDARRVLTGSSDGVRLFDAGSGQLLRHLKTGPCKALSPSVDWRFVALAEPDAVSRWDLESGARVWGAPHFHVDCVAYDPTGRWVLSAGGNPRNDRSIHQWSVTTGECVRKLKGHQEGLESAFGVLALAVRPDGRRALSGGGDGSARLWDLETGVCLKRFDLTGESVSAVAFAANEAWVITGSARPSGGQPKLRIWQAATGRCVRTFANDGGCVAAAGRRIVSGWGGTVTVRDLPEEFPPVGSLRVSRPRSQTFVSETEERVARLLAEARESIAGRAFGAALSKVREARALPGWERSPRCLAVWSALAAFCARTELRSAWRARVLQGCLAGVSADGRLALTRGPGLRLWDIASGRCVLTVEAGSATAAALSPDGRWAIAAGTPADGQPIGPHVLRLWDLSTSGAVRDLTGHSMRVQALSWSADGHSVLSAGMDGARLWDVDSGQCLQAFAAGMVFDAALSADGKRIVIAKGKDLSLWDPATGQVGTTWEAHPSDTSTKPINGLCMSADGARVLTGGSDECARLWDLTDGRCLAECATNIPVEAVALSPEGRFAFVGSADWQVRAWDVATDRRRLAIETLEAPKRLALARDGRFLLAEVNGSVHVHELDWEMETRREAGQDEVGNQGGQAEHVEPLAAHRATNLLRLVLIERAGDEPHDMEPGQVIELALEFGRPYILGKDPNADVVVRARAVGRSAVRLTATREEVDFDGVKRYRDQVWITDLGSGGGSSLETNGAVTHRPEHCRLHHGATLRFGRFDTLAFRVELSRGPGRDVNDPSWTLLEASSDGRVDVVRRLLDEGADPNGPHERTGDWACPINRAANAWTVTPDHVAVVALLLARGASADTGFDGMDSMGTPEDHQILDLLAQYKDRARPVADPVSLRLLLIGKAGNEPLEMELGHVIEISLELEKRYVIGRSPDADIVVKAAPVGRNALGLTSTADGVWIEDLHSGGSTSVEMHGVVTHRPHCRIRNGAILRLGKTGVTLRVEFISRERIASRGHA